jgi:RNA polymerase sigma-70 factor, ECF subfamily
MDVWARLQQARIDRWARRAASGDRAAFRRLYAALHPLVEGYVGRRTSSREDAEDLVSRTFEKLVGSLAAIDPAKGGARAFVIGIARNALIDARRTRKVSAPLEPLGDVLASEGENAHQAIERREKEAEVRAAVATLPEDVRELFELRFGEGLAWREIAALTDHTEASARQRVSRALREMKTSLAEGKREVLPCVD